MKKTNKLGKSLIVTIITIELLAMSAFAQDENVGYRNGFSAGPGVVVSDKPYKGMDNWQLKLAHIRVKICIKAIAILFI